MRKLTLESRIARLEKLFNIKKAVKNESALPNDLYLDLADVFDEHFGSEDNYSSARELKDHLFAASQCENDMMVDNAIMYLASDFGYDEDELEDLRNEITDDLAELADNTLNELDPLYAESCKRRRSNRRFRR